MFYSFLNKLTATQISLFKKLIEKRNHMKVINIEVDRFPSGQRGWSQEPMRKASRVRIPFYPHFTN